MTSGHLAYVQASEEDVDYKSSVCFVSALLRGIYEPFHTVLQTAAAIRESSHDLDTK